jgi:hypothetical protein
MSEYYSEYLYFAFPGKSVVPDACRWHGLLFAPLPVEKIKKFLEMLITFSYKTF